MNESYWLTRTELLLGKEKLEVLKSKHVLVAGLGGVGAYAAEQICRAGVGEMTIIDGDVVNTSNRNRQLPALISNQGKAKAEVMAERLLDINPELKLNVINEYIRDERMIEILDNHYDYVVDAIDTLSPKIYLIYYTLKNGLKLVSSMGAGGKTDPTKILIDDFGKTYNCKLAYILRKRLRKLDVRGGFKVIFSTEQVDKEAVVVVEGEENKKSAVGTISFMPPLFGCFCASVVINDLIDNEKDIK